MHVRHTETPQLPPVQRRTIPLNCLINWHNFWHNWHSYQGVFGGYSKCSPKWPDQVSWHDAMEFCYKLSQRTGRAYTLPTEAQWEYACRAGTTTPFWFGATLSTDQAYYDASYVYGLGRECVYHKHTTRVGDFPPNGYGLHDMHGYVWEWCRDWGDKDFYGHSAARVCNPTEPATG